MIDLARVPHHQRQHHQHPRLMLSATAKFRTKMLVKLGRTRKLWPTQCLGTRNLVQAATKNLLTKHHPSQLSTDPTALQGKIFSWLFLSNNYMNKLWVVSFYTRTIKVKALECCKLYKNKIDSFLWQSNEPNPECQQNSLRLQHVQHVDQLKHRQGLIKCVR